MIAYLRGRVLTTTAETMILDVNGVGYEVYCSGGAFAKVGNGDIAELYTYLQAKEDGMTLFGFASPKEKELFLKLISVSGVGPKMGIAVLSALSGDDFAAAVATADVKRLSAVKGLGKKTAEKIILELHGKISAAEVISAGGGRSERGRGCGRRRKRQAVGGGRRRGGGFDGTRIYPRRECAGRKAGARNGGEHHRGRDHESLAIGRIGAEGRERENAGSLFHRRTAGKCRAFYRAGKCVLTFTGF